MNLTRLARTSLLLLTFTALTGTGCAVHHAPPPRSHKVLVCHKGKTLEIAEAAIDAHLRHGDRRSPCR